LFKGSCTVKERTNSYVCVAACRIVYDADFEAQEAADNPVLTFEGLHRVLAFADAVDSAHGVMKHWMSKLGELRLHAALGKQQLVLRPNGIDYMWLRASEDSESELQLAGYPPGKLEPEGVGQPAASNEQKQAFKQQVAAQTEQLLWLAYRLQLQPLVHHLHGFIRSSCLSPISLLHGQEAAVITPRVLEAAVASGKHGVWQAVADSVRRQDVAFTDDAMLGDTAAFLAPLTLTQQQKQPLEFDAMLHADVMGIASGTKVRVYLDLFGESSIHLNQDIHTVRLRIGPFSFR
jgi:hypothetical protein